MATAPTPLHVQQESDVIDARHEISIATTAPTPAASDRRTMNPLLIAIFVALAAFPFLVGFLPSPVVQHFDALFHR
jgi:hypothetical protein